MRREKGDMKWQYKTLRLAAHGFLGGKVDLEKFEQELDRLGEDGWELVNAFDTNQSSGATRDVIAVFKRPVASDA
jgi:hypothetical protein